jgi:hypothetical protein
VATITVPNQTEYDESSRVFTAMSQGLERASDLLQTVTFLPGAFVTATDLERSVDDYLSERRQTLQVFAEAAASISEIVQLTGEVYNETEKQRESDNQKLESRIQAAGQKLSELHHRYDSITQSQPDNTRPRQSVAKDSISSQPVSPGGSTTGSGGINRFGDFRTPPATKPAGATSQP